MLQIIAGHELNIRKNIALKKSNPHVPALTLSAIYFIKITSKELSREALRNPFFLKVYKLCH